ncbi:MAG: hemerythrin domain-containing protein [Candidatus Omnitrophota bacterium]
MSETIETLRKEHEQICRDLDELRGLTEGCPLESVIEDLERLIVSHVSREDVEVYGPLRKLATLSSEADAFLTKSRQDLEYVKISALIFFEKYRGKSPAMCGDFKKDLERLSGKIRARIDLENRELFPFLLNFWKTLK